MTRSAAVDAIEREGFRREPDGACRKCERTYSGGYGGQWQHVVLRAARVRADRTIVEVPALVKVYG